MSAATFSWGSVSQPQGPLGDRSPEKPRRQEAREKKKRVGAAQKQGCHPQPPSIGLDAQPCHSRSPGEVPNKPWEGQRRAGGRGEREVTELENLG